MYDVIVIGAGVIGGMISRELMRKNLSLCILERENDVACGSSKANSGIVHGGYDPVPGTLKAKLNTVGVEKLFKAAAELGVHIKRNGSMVLAFGDEDDIAVKALYDRGITNGIPGMEIISGDKARELEPTLSESVTSALLVTNSGIVCPYMLTTAAVGNAMDNGAELKLNFEVVSIEKKDDSFAVTSASGECVEGKYVVNCAGGWSGKIASMIGDDSIEIMPRPGEYLILDKNVGNTVSRTIFQVPSKDGKGILVTPTVDGNLMLGPTASSTDSPDDKKTTIEGLEKVQTLAKKSVPSVNPRAVITSFTGVRASIKSGDFIIGPSKADGNFINVAAIDSPGLTCCVSIAEYVSDVLKKAGLEAEDKKDFNPTREDTSSFRRMKGEEKDKFIKSNPDYGKIVCRCEKVSEGEIRKVLRMNPKPSDIDGVKRRTRAGMGRCQGGFCMPYVMKIISEERGIPMSESTKNGNGSYIVSGKL